MRRPSWSFYACATAILASECCAVALQGCGIMVAADCAQRAVCLEEAGETQDVTTPEGIDGIPTDAETGDAAKGEAVTSEPLRSDGDAGEQDVVSEDVVTARSPLPDGSCNSPYTCAAPVPAGWSGPALFWTDNAGSTPPTCPTNYLQSGDLHQNLSGTEPDTCNCTCSLSDTCVATVTFHPDQLCSTPTCPSGDGGTETIQLALSQDSGCTPIPDNDCGTTGSVMTTNPTAYAATCVPEVAPIHAASWSNSARLCSTSCSSSADPCEIGPTTNFHTTACVFQPGDVPCPMAAYVNRSLFYSGVNDTRRCSDCTCRAPEGGTCVYLGGSAGSGSSLTVYSSSDCSTGGGSWTDLSLDICSVYNATNSTLGSNPASVTYNPTLRHGTCPGVESHSQPRGSVTPTGATTVCCM